MMIMQILCGLSIFICLFILGEHVSAIMHAADHVKQQLKDSSKKLSEVSCSLNEKQIEHQKLKSIIENKLGSRTKRLGNP